MTTLLIISLHLGGKGIIQSKFDYSSPAECQRASRMVKSRTYRILWKGCI